LTTIDNGVMKLKHKNCFADLQMQNIYKKKVGDFSDIGIDK